VVEEALRVYLVGSLLNLRCSPNLKEDRDPRRRDMPRKANTSVATEFYTVNQLADLFQLTPITIYRMIKQGKLAYHSIGRVKRIHRRDVAEFLSRHRTPRKTSYP
jgi:excisionase family DNA binding protein